MMSILFSMIVGGTVGWCGYNSLRDDDFVGLALCITLFLANIARPFVGA
jgi:hypothetical protein